MFQAISDRKILIPALIGAFICVLLINTGFLGLFFLVPLGFLGFRYDYKVAWTGFLFAVLGNLILTIAVRSGGSEAGWEILYFTAMTGIFTWVISPPPAGVQLPFSARLVSGSCIGALLVTVILYRLVTSLQFTGYMDSLLESFLAMQSTSNANVVETALLDTITGETVLQMVWDITIRGGSLVSCILLFGLCRQISLSLARLVLRRKGNNKLNDVNALWAFHVNPMVIWVLSGALLLVVFSRMVQFAFFEIVLWNILILCVILYFAQGLGIVQAYLVRPSTPPFLGIVFLVLFFLILFSPLLNMALLGGLTILGIAENWVPFRAPKKNGPASTPESS